MGTSIYSITSNVYVEMRDRRYRKLVHDRALMLSAVAAIVSTLLIQISYAHFGSISAESVIGLAAATLSCLCTMVPDRSYLVTVSFVLAVTGALLSGSVFF